MKETQVNVSEEPIASVTTLQSHGEREDVSTWEMVKRHKVAVVWSGFFALAAINWGMDIQVSKRFISQTFA